MVDCAGQAVPKGPFSWRSRPSARLLEWRSTPSLDIAIAEHDAYADLPDPVRHRRCVFFVKPRVWVVVDDLEGAADHHVELRFQFAPMEVRVDAEPWVRAWRRDGCALWIRAFAAAPLAADIVEGQQSPIQGWVSDDYGRRCPAPLLTYSATARLPFRIATLIHPADGATPPEVSVISEASGRPVGLVLPGTAYRIRFGD